MGLDMWLIKKNENEEKKEVSYWRKANAIHNWFVETVQGGVDDQKEYYVTEEQLNELLNLCIDVKRKMRVDEKGDVKNKDDMKELLPTREGFFFGTYHYDKWYVEDIESTIEQIKHVIDTTNFNKEKIYYTCWW